MQQSPLHLSAVGWAHPRTYTRSWCGLRCAIKYM